MCREAAGACDIAETCDGVSTECPADEFDAQCCSEGDCGMDVGTDTGSDAGADASMDAGSDAGTDTGADTGVDVGEPDADTGDPPDTDPNDAGPSDASIDVGADGSGVSGEGSSGGGGCSCTASGEGCGRYVRKFSLLGLMLAVRRRP